MPESERFVPICANCGARITRPINEDGTHGCDECGEATYVPLVPPTLAYAIKRAKDDAEIQRVSAQQFRISAEGRAATIERLRQEYEALESNRDGAWAVVERYRLALQHISEYGTREGDLRDGWDEAMRNIARNTLFLSDVERDVPAPDDEPPAFTDEGGEHA